MVIVTWSDSTRQTLDAVPFRTQGALMRNRSRSVPKVLARSLLLFSLFAACGESSTPLQREVAGDIRRAMREQDIPAEVTANGSTLTVVYDVALIQYAPGSFARQQGEAGLARLRGAGFETVEFRAKDNTGQERTDEFRVADLDTLAGPPPPSAAHRGAPDIAPWQSPGRACRYLVSDGLRTGRYHAPGGGEHFCYADISLGEDLPVSNEIHYMPTGTPDRVTQIQLGAETFNYDRIVDRMTLERAARLAPKLTLAAVGDSLPAEAADAIRTATTGSWIIGGAMVRVDREDHGPGRGYSIYLRIVETP